MICQFCGLEYSDFDNLAEHVLKHLSEQTLQYPELQIKQENFISCGSGSDEDAFPAETYYSEDDANEDIQHDENKADAVFDTYPTSEQEIKNSDKTSLQCAHCDKKFATPKSRTNHESSHNGHRPFECHICSKTYYSKTSFKYHIGTHRDEKKERAICTFCGKSISSTLRLNIHIRENHLPDTDPRRYFNCKYCDSQFKTAYHLHLHNLTHKNSTVTYTCDYCKTEYKARKHIVAHMYAVHSNLKLVHKCSFCPKTFRTKGQLEDHENGAHKKKQTHVCPLCFKYFAYKVSLRRHHRTAHINDKTVTPKPIKCQIRDNHLNKHTGPFQCPLCPRSFSMVKYLRKHQKRLHFSEEDKQVIAKTIVTHKCSYCSKVYRRKKEFDNHLKSHSGVLPFQCQSCSKGFIGQRQFNRHIKKCSVSPT